MTGGMIERKPRTEQFFFADFFTLALVIYGYRYINKFVQQCEKDGFMTPDTLTRYKRVVKEYVAYENNINIFGANFTLKQRIIEKMDETLSVNNIQAESTFFNFCTHEGLTTSAGYAAYYNMGLNYLNMARMTCHGKTDGEDIGRVQEKYHPDAIFKAVSDLGQADCFETQDNVEKRCEDRNVINCLLVLVRNMQRIYLAVCEEQQAWFEQRMAQRCAKIKNKPLVSSIPLSRAERRQQKRKNR